MLFLGFPQIEPFFIGWRIVDTRFLRESFEVDDTRSASLSSPSMIFFSGLPFEVDDRGPVLLSLSSSSFSVSFSRFSLEVPALTESNVDAQSLSPDFCGNLTTLLDP